MKYLDADRDPRAARALLDRLRESATRPWTVLELCGGQAQNLARLGADRGWPGRIEIVHGPGCPVSATPAPTIDRALALATRPGLIVCASADLLRVPGSVGSLQEARDRGAEVRTVYSPLDALAMARKHPDRDVVMLAVGFETTAPAAAAAVLEADRLGLENLSLLTSFFRASVAVEAMLAGPGRRARAVLAPGPACAVTGFRDYEPIAERYRVPVVVTGPEPVDLLDALGRAVGRLEAGTYGVENQYARAVRPDGQPQALAAIAAVFAEADADWRGLGRLRGSGLALRDRFRRFDARARYPGPPESGARAPRPDADECLDGDVLAGRIKPGACPAFGVRCTPDRPLGAGMASPEGVCAAYHRHRRPQGNADAEPTTVVLPAPAVPNA